MKKKILISILFFSILSITSSEVLSIGKNQILDEGTTNYLNMKLCMDIEKIDEVSLFFLGHSSEVVSPLLLKTIVILCLCIAATIIGVLLLFYRKNHAVQVGIVTGILAVIVSSGWFSVLWFFLAGGAPVYLSRYEIQHYKESGFMALKAAIILFLTHYLINAVINYSGIAGGHGVEDLTEVAGDTVMGLGLYIGLQVSFLCLLSVLGGLITFMVLKAERMIREEGKREKNLEKKQKQEPEQRE